MMHHRSMPDVVDQAAALGCTIIVQTADCAAPIQFIHAEIDSFAGYFFNVNAYGVYMFREISEYPGFQVFMGCFYFIYVTSEITAILNTILNGIPFERKKSKAC